MPSGRPTTWPSMHVPKHRSSCPLGDLVSRHALPPAPRVIPLALGCPRKARSDSLGRMPSVGWPRMPNVLEQEHHHKFEKIGKLVSYATEVTAVVEKNKIKKLTGVKTKELLVWITLSDIYVDDPPTGKITFQTPAGLHRSFPVSAFEIEGEVSWRKARRKTNEWCCCCCGSERGLERDASCAFHLWIIISNN
ncbi:putative Aproteint domain-containing protein [Hibiscus syriacus]|uniref:Aproteint domain-containing protein n=1 Tax=Hibiscus syriacus TaxID=106335 RepID=A0A6A3BZS0_HIBSY|nr:putative Aproteint domain-containing protein [Hibiscus syriacus]